MMTAIQKDECIFYVDTEKTKKYYKTHSVCDCALCRNCCTQIKEKLPKLNDFLSEFGVDIAKPDEIMSVIADDDCIDYICVDYTVCGNVKSVGEYKVDVYDNLFLSIVVVKGFASPNEQTEEYFTMSVRGIRLSWMLDEPFPRSVTAKAILKKNIFHKIFGK
ncbi:MAG: hypothetical protein HFE78_05595 [Clostridiales bacterium]|nr:hypothetical protein [Clostridiales bacterium]